MLAVVNGDGPNWEPFQMPRPDSNGVPRIGGAKAAAPAPRGRGPGAADWWLRGAAVVLGVLAAAAAGVSWQAQYVMVLGVKHAQAVAAVEAGIPDAGAVIFAALGVALALHGKRAPRPRVLNVACVGISLAMNALAAGHGWRDLAIWVMPAAVYAVASDTLISVVRARVLARQRADGTGLADDTQDLLATLGGGALWVLRLLLAGPSTLRGFRAWVVEECPVAPGRKAARALPTASIEDGPSADPVTAPPPPPSWPRLQRARGGQPTKRDRLIALAAERRDLVSVPLAEVAKLASALADEIGYSPGTARRELVRHVRDLQSSTAESAPSGQGEGHDG